MKTRGFLFLAAILPLACGQGAGSEEAAGQSAKAAPAKKQVSFVVPAGTLLPIEFETTVSSDTSHEGDAVLAVLTESVPLDGFTLQQGAEVRGRVVTAVAAKRVSGRSRLVLAFDTVTFGGKQLSINTEPIDTTGASTGSKDKKIIGGGALGGLIVGAIKDGKKGAVIGTVVGAAAGTGAVLVMKGHEVEIPRGAQLTVRVTG